MKKIKLFLAVAAMFVPFFAQAQSVEPEMGREMINGILSNCNDYLFADCTMDSEEIALDKAMQELQSTVRTYLQDNNVKTAKADKILSEVMTYSPERITFKRNDKFRAFVYVAKSSVDSVAVKYVKGGIGNKNVQETPAAPSIAETVAAEQPVTEPVQESVQEPVEEAQEPVTNDEDVYTDDEVADSAEEEGDDKEETITAIQKLINDVSSLNKKQILALLKTISTLDDFQKYMAAFKLSGVVGEYDKYQKISDPAAYYILIYDRKGDVKALLSPGRQTRTNLLTDKQDQVDYYKGYAAIGFRLLK